MINAKKIECLIGILIFPLLLLSQNCSLSLKGTVLDTGTKIPLPFSTIYLKGENLGTSADDQGHFEIENLCAGEYHIEVSHIGCEAEEIFLKLSADTIVNILLHHHDELLDEVLVHGTQEDNSAQMSNTISTEEINQKSNQNIADILEGIAGVSTLKNGSGISKPVIHGLYGNRVAVLNNGVIQSGQQWGNDHAPEIDPFVADHISVVKGAAALAYGGNALGSVVLVESDNIKEDPHLHGKANYIFESNGLGHTANLKLSKFDKWAAWQIGGTFKRKGDNHTPNYFLTNTGKSEANASVQLEKKISKSWESQLYYSLFQTEIGVLRGSHIANLTDLQSALSQSVPFFTKDTFSYEIGAPRQEVKHHLLKWENQFFLNEATVLKFKYAGQINDRKEYDVRRGGRTDTPSLSLDQTTHFGELILNKTFSNQLFLKTGLQYTFVDNDNVFGTGTFPLIPDYRKFQPSAFAILQKEKGNLFLEIGARYDLKHLRVAWFTQGANSELMRTNHTFNNYSVSGGLRYRINPNLKVRFNIGHMLRSPEINELYSAGLHQGISAIEQGNPALKSERSVKLIGNIDWFAADKLFVQVLGYFQNINDYIYLKPADEFRLTIRGSFPVFNYEQTDTRIYGTDILLSFEPQEHLKLTSKYAIVRANDLTADLALINIPADNWTNTLSYSLRDHTKFKNSFFAVNGKYVFRNNRLEPGQDFIPTPEAYFLLGLSMGTQLQMDENKLKLSLSVENALNATYRDYLNRLRYFADDPGRSINVRLAYEF